MPRLGRFDRVALARRLFGRSRVDAAFDRVIQALVDWGYAPAPLRCASLRMTLCEVFRTIKSPCLEQISTQVLIHLRVATSSHKRLATTTKHEQLLLEHEILRDHRSNATGATQLRGHDGEMRPGE